ncbi:MAG: O-antigen ligase family protein [Clostridia bacterium]|nr:O-antigen ligase family protein [Clostridia bacterium]
MMKKAENAVRRALLQIAGNESLFLFAAFLVIGVLPSDLLRWHQEQVALLERYVIVPWGMALSLLRLQRRSALEGGETRLDLYALGLLLAWVVVPFGIRFGLTFNNISSWTGHCIVYFGIYALLTERAAQERERLFDQACLLLMLASLVLGGALLYCAAEGISIGSDVAAFRSSGGTTGFGFGVFNGANLCAGMHYNSTAMVTLCMAMFCFAGMCRSRGVLRALYAAVSAALVVVIVLTQSRTARYALMLALAAGAYGYLAANLRFSRAVVRHAAGLVAAAVVLAATYVGASMLTDAALSHYADVQSGKDVAIVAAARAEEGAGETAKKAVKPKAARAAVDSTMSGRTDIWKNLFKLWKNEPKSLLIGNGIGRTGSRIVEGTIHEKNGAVPVHNTYLQHIADFGLIGFSVMCAFLLIVLVPALRVFFARGAAQTPGYRALCMLVVACLMTGMMESAPLGAMTPMNMMLFYALALLAARGREIAPCKA